MMKPSVLVIVLFALTACDVSRIDSSQRGDTSQSNCRKFETPGWKPESPWSTQTPPYPRAQGDKGGMIG